MFNEFYPYTKLKIRLSKKIDLYITIAAKGDPLPVVVPKLITMDEAAQMLGISLANFKKQEPYLPFKRKYVGHGIRYRNTDIIKFILSDEPQPLKQILFESCCLEPLCGSRQ